MSEEQSPYGSHAESNIAGDVYEATIHHGGSGARLPGIPKLEDHSLNALIGSIRSFGGGTIGVIFANGELHSSYRNQ